MRKVLYADVMMPKAERNIQPAVVDLLGGGAYLVEFFHLLLERATGVKRIIK